MAKSFEGFEVHNLTGLFKEAVGQNYLLQELGIFRERTSSLPKIELDELSVAAQTVAKQVNRYSTEVDVTVRDKGKNRLLEISHHVLTGTCSAADFQGVRRLGQQRETTMSELLSDEAFRQYYSYRRTKEQYLARALFAGQVQADYTGDRPLLDFEQEFGTSHGAATITAIAGGEGPLESLETAATDIKFKIGGWAQAMRGLVVLCSPSFYRGVKYHNQLTKLIEHGVLAESTLFNNAVKQNLPAFSAMVIDGVTYVNTGTLYSEYIAAGEAYMLPVFGNTMVGSDLSPYEVIAGPASRNATLAAAQAESDIFQYYWDDHLGNRSVQSEFGILPIVYDQSFISKLTLNTSAA